VNRRGYRCSRRRASRSGRRRSPTRAASRPRRSRAGARATAASCPRACSPTWIRASPAASSAGAYDTTHRDIVGFCHAGTSRRGGAAVGELYEIYLVDRAKRFGLGRELFDEFSTWCLAEQKREMAVWVLEDNHHARAFYAALGGRQVGRLGSRVGGFPVVEVSYVWPL
jgi:GNAT superfamily N-acetyltransferase